MNCRFARLASAAAALAHAREVEDVPRQMILLVRISSECGVRTTIWLRRAPVGLHQAEALAERAEEKPFVAILAFFLPHRYARCSFRSRLLPAARSLGRCCGSHRLPRERLLLDKPPSRDVYSTRCARAMRDAVRSTAEGVQRRAGAEPASLSVERG